MNDRAVSVLSEYEFEVIRTWKGRGAILFETPEGIRILKEYKGVPEKLGLQKALLDCIRENSGLSVEDIIPNKEGMLFTKDAFQDTYVVKSYFDARECSIRDREECRKAVSVLARLHRAMSMPMAEKPPGSALRLDKEYEKHNRELKKVRRFLRNKGQKNDFEIYLLKYYDRFMEKAFEVSRLWSMYQKEDYYEKIAEQGIWCHGDFQHHNLLLNDAGAHVINFEKCTCDTQMRDLYLFLRKLLEKTDWSVETGEAVLEAYEKEKPLSKEDMEQLYYRLSYPEKFWKIVNFYYNTGKSWVPGRNMEKFDILLKQEREKEKFLNTLLH